MKKVMMLMGALVVAGAGLVAVAADRDTPQRTGDTVALTAGEDLDAGVLCGVWTNGYVYAAGLTKSLTIIGRAEAAADSGETAVVRRGVYRWDNGGDTVADKDIGAIVYVWTNTAYTVCLTPLAAAATNTAGTVVDVDTEGVWVRSGL